MSFTCKRCGYVCGKRAILQGHLSRKTACAATVSDVATTVLLAELEHKNKLTCATCQKSFIKPGMLIKHRETCVAAPTVPAQEDNRCTPGYVTMRSSDLETMKQQLMTLVNEVSFLKGFLLGEARNQEADHFAARPRSGCCSGQSCNS